MSTTDNRQSSTTQDLVTIFVSLELSRTRWLVTSTFHGGNKMSRTSLAAGDGQALLDLLAQIRTRVERLQGLAGKIKARPETIEAFCAIADSQGWGFRETFEHAVELLQRELAKGRDGQV